MTNSDRSRALHEIAAAVELLRRAAEAEGEATLAYLISAARTEAEYQAEQDQGGGNQ